MNIDRTEMETLIENLESSDPEIQELAAIQLGIFGKGNNKLVENYLLQALDNSRDKYVKKSLICALGKIKSQRAVPALKQLLENDNFDVRWVAAEALEEIADRDSIPALINCLEKENRSQIKESILRTLGKFNTKEILLALSQAVTSTKEQTMKESNLAEQKFTIPILKNNLPQPIINLTKWLETKIPDPGWQPRGYFFPNYSNKLAYRSCIDLILFCNKIDLQDLNSSVILTVLVEQQEEETRDITVLIEPLNQKYLPPNLKMIILDSENNSVTQAKSMYDNPSVKFEFQAEQKDYFGFKLIASNFSYQRNFIV